VTALRFYRRLYVTALKSRAEYRGDFAVSVVTAFLMQLSALSFYWVVFARVPALGGFSAANVLSLFGLCAMTLALSELLFNGIWQLPFYIQNGEMDRLLIYPVDSLLFLLVSRPELHALGNFLSGAVLLGISWHLEPPPALAYALLPVWLLSGSIVYSAALVVIGCLSFVMVGPWSFHYFIAFHLLNATRYPVNIYPRWLRGVLLFVMPLAVSTFLPVAWVTGRGSFWLALLAPPVAAVLSAAVAAVAFRAAIRRYQSTGT
jgi:ABC-2 type transport system permease protein